MVCGGCKKRQSRHGVGEVYDVMGGYKHLPDRQLRARLETYKKLHCNECDSRYVCDFTMYSNCTIKTIKE